MTVAKPKVVRRGSYLLLVDFERVEDWCRLVRVLFGDTPFMVGSVNDRPDFRDVDIRLILRDAKYDRTWRNPLKVRLMNRAISTWGQRETGLPIDFQIQRMTEANAAWPKGFRNPMGIRDWSKSLPGTGRP